ncbi:MAG: hypothetical protein LUF26_00985 [Firmicutes bacterium]|nr:hypothetical protein [Bacillota bacterium]
MDCEKFNECLDNYENLSEENRVMMAVHAAECESCKRELEFMLSIMETVRTLPKIDTPPDFMDNLNLRIDAVERENRRIAKRIALNIRKNRKRYATAAACFALVAVLTANGKSLIGNMDGSDGSDGGVIIETTVTENSDTAQTQDVEAISEEADTADTAEAAAVEAETAETQTNSAAEPVVKSIKTVAAANTAQTDNQTAAAVAVTAEPVAVTADASEEADTAVSTDTETVADTAIVAETPAAVESAEGYALQTNSAADGSDGYATTEVASHPHGEMPPNGGWEESDAQVDYSLAEVGSIAKGRSYNEETNKEKAIGSLKISESDAERAMDVILMYSYGFSDEYYSTNADSLSMMLSKLSQKGVDYKNYIPSYDGDITFKLVIQ